jgi:hypothetical protein
MGDRARQISGKAHDLSERASQAISERAANLGENMDRMQTRARSYAQENPLAVGAAVVALGIGAGLLIPSSRHERRLMGPARDRLLGRAQGVAEQARGAAHHIEETTRQTGRDVQQALTEREFPH